MKRTALTLVMALIFSFFFGGILVQPVQSQFLGSIYIASDGSVVGTNTIQRNGNIYTLTANISGGIQVQKSNIVIDGAGYTVQENGAGRGLDLSNGVGEDPSRSIINNVTLKNLRIVGFDFGVLTLGGDNHTFYNNYIANCDEACIDLRSSSYNNITYCTIEGNTISMNNNIITYTYEDGIKLTNSSNNIVSNNVIYSYADLYSVPYSRGIALENGSKNTISENRVTGNCYGVYLRLSDNNTISGNSITKSEFGIDLYSSSGNNLTGNAVFSTVLAIFRGVYSDSGTGIWFEVNSTCNQFHKNNVKNNGEAMRIWDYSSNNMIYENNFINNTNQISIIIRGIPDPQSIPIPNYWDNGTVGNYWSDYLTNYPNATEIGNSGIGNTPYIVDANNIDHYPLMNPVAIPELPDGTGETEPFPTTLVVASVVLVAVIGIGLVIYFRKRNSSG